MRRVTVTLPDELEEALDAFLAAQEAPPSVSTVLRKALSEYLRSQALRARGVDPSSPRPPVDIPVLEEIGDEARAMAPARDPSR